MDDKTWLGALAEAKVTASLLHHRWEVFTPVTGKAPFDLIAVRGLQLRKVEVKGCGTRRPNGGFAVHLRSIRPNRSGNTIRFLDPAVSDVVAVYLEPIDRTCFFRTAELAGRSTITVHEQPSLNGTPRHLIADYAMLDDGTVAERTKATALKVVDPRGSVGSNPTRSAPPSR